MTSFRYPNYRSGVGRVVAETGSMVTASVTMKSLAFSPASTPQRTPLNWISSMSPTTKNATGHGANYISVVDVMACISFSRL
jgi:hypothetical protein